MPRLAVAIALLLALQGCTGGGATPATPVAGSGGAGSGGAAATEALPGADPLAFTATTVQGEAFDGADYAGQDLMVWFWAPW
jgi:hypothetical protein